MTSAPQETPQNIHELAAHRRLMNSSTAERTWSELLEDQSHIPENELTTQHTPPTPRNVRRWSRRKIAGAFVVALGLGTLATCNALFFPTKKNDARNRWEEAGPHPMIAHVLRDLDTMLSDALKQENTNQEQELVTIYNHLQATLIRCETDKAGYEETATASALAGKTAAASGDTQRAIVHYDYALACARDGNLAEKIPKKVEEWERALRSLQNIRQQ